MSKEKKRCYNCGKESEKGSYLPVVESPKDIECPPKAWFCLKCRGEMEDN